MYAENVGDAAARADDGHVALSKYFEWRRVDRRGGL